MGPGSWRGGEAGERRLVTMLTLLSAPPPFPRCLSIPLPPAPPGSPSLRPSHPPSPPRPSIPLLHAPPIPLLPSVLSLHPPWHLFPLPFSPGPPPFCVCPCVSAPLGFFVCLSVCLCVSLCPSLPSLFPPLSLQVGWRRKPTTDLSPTTSRLFLAPAGRTAHSVPLILYSGGRGPLSPWPRPLK